MVEADERPVGGQLARLERPLRRVADDEGDTVLTQERLDVRLEPAPVAKLEAMATRGQTLEGRREPLVVAMEVGGKLPEHRSELRRVDQRLDSLVEALHTGAEVRQPLARAADPDRSGTGSGSAHGSGL